MKKVGIIGTGLIGTSLGLAMKQAGMKNVQIVGTDIEKLNANRAEKMGAIDHVSRRLAGAAEDAQVVFIATPVSAIKEVLEIIGPSLQDGCVVTDTAPTKRMVLEWADQYLPRTVSFVGGHPMVSRDTSGPKDADGSIFRDHPYCIIPGECARQDGVRLLTDLVTAMGAKPYFMDVAEHDSFVSGVSHLPVLLAVALLGCTSKSSSWSDIARVASAQFRDLTGLAAGNAVTGSDISFGNNQDIVYWIDSFIHELYEIRRILVEQEEGREQALEKVFDQAAEARARWVAGLVKPLSESDYQGPKIPSAMEGMTDLFLGDSKVRRRVLGWSGRSDEDKDSGKRK